MNFDRMSGHRVPPWAIIVLAGLGLWLTFGSRSGSAPVVSGWRGDNMVAQNAVGGLQAPQPAALAGIFSKQNTPQSTNLAAHPAPQDVPAGNPTDTTAVVMTQGYGVGSHAPAAVWGGIDLAIDGNGDGEADPGASQGAPIYATMSGVIELAPNSVPAGNHIWIKNEHYKVGFGHLADFAVEDGQTVQRGDLIGHMGSTGNSSGPHLHYHIWQDGVNVDPQGFSPLP